MRRSSQLATLAAVVLFTACTADGPTAIPDAGPVSFNIASGNTQVGDPGVELPAALVVIATDAKGKPVKGQLVNYVVVSGGGSLFAGSSLTDNKGQAQDYWTLGESGAQVVEVRAVDPTTGQKYTFATFTATFNPPPDIDADGDGVLGSVDCNDGDPSIHPGASDDPDDSFIDSNCDGLDGDKATAVFVARNGMDVASCGATPGGPCQNISFGIQRAIAMSRSRIFVAMGDYPEAVTLFSGINLYGGYAADFSIRSIENRATVNGSASLDGNFGQRFTMLAHELTQPTEVSMLIIRGPDAPTGASSHALVIRNGSGTFRLSRSRVVAGNGGSGVSGADGANGFATPAGAGFNGLPGGVVGFCDDNTRGVPGNGGVASAGSNNGGRGGNGGQADIDCQIFSLNLNPRAGQQGSTGFPFADPFGVGGNGGAACAPGQTGVNGRTTHGADGTGGSDFAVVNGFLVTGAGVSGALGQDGTGGGGGGGGGGCNTGDNAFGPGGGGGGAGGLRAPLAGMGGGGGGASVGIFVINASPTLTDVEIIRGNGGNGGAGGNGGRGQVGGAGGAGGAGVAGTQAAGAGGRGGDGGNAGSGGGGAGGAAIGILAAGAAVVDDAGVIYSGGAGGAGGVGGSGPASAAPAGAAGSVLTKVAK